LNTPPTPHTPTKPTATKPSARNKKRIAKI
jgi:hypothetical protein